MREILFRGKNKEDGEWIYGNLIINHNYCNNTIESCSIFSLDIVDANGSYCGYDFVEIEPETVGQYTGLTDKNGNKIFEGDIFAVPEEEGYFVVQWGDGYFELQFYGYYEKCLDGNAYETVWDKLDVDPIWDWNLENMEIVGNIYDR